MEKNHQYQTIASVLKACMAMLLLAFASQSLVSCSDEPTGDNYYTFTGEMASDYLDNRPEMFSEFTKVLQRSGVYGKIATYGSYTCLAPTNEAMEQYLRSRGLSSVDDLSKADCDTLSWNHVVQKAYFTPDLVDGRFPDKNMNDRYLTFSCDSTATNGNLMYYVNTSKLIVRDDSVENGVVHTLDRVIEPSSLYLREKMKEDPNISLFVEALELTGLGDSLYLYEDPDYSIADLDSVYKGVDFHRTNFDGKIYYPEKRYRMFTALVETNDVFTEAGINNIEDLKVYAKTVYDAMYPNDKDLYDDDYTNRKNPLNRFVAYHLLPYYAAVNDFTVSDSGIDYKKTCAKTNLIDCTDWFTTMMPGTIMKASSPAAGLYINRKGVDSKYTVEGVKVYGPTEMKAIHDQGVTDKGYSLDDYKLDQQGMNGIYHYIDKVLVYDETTRDVVFNDRIRWDVITLSPEFLNAGARGNTNQQHMMGLKQVEGWDFHGIKPKLAVRERGVWNFTYADAIDLVGQFDVSFKLPPLPENTYEIRFAYGVGNTRGVVQIYFGKKKEDGTLDLRPMGQPIDFRVWGGDPKIGYVADTEDEDENRAIDKAMHNRGYMKDMDSWYQGGANSLRNSENSAGKLRKILTTQQLSPNEEYWLRIKLTIDNSKAELPINYFEFCPKSVYAGVVAEDTH